MHLAPRALTLTGNHVAVRAIGTVGLVAAAHIEIVLPTDGRVRTMAVRIISRTRCNPLIGAILLAEVLDLCEHA